MYRENSANSGIPAGLNFQLPHDARRGSTLVVIIALMAMLALLGVTFFTFATQEQDNAENFLEAAKRTDEADLGPDVYFNWALRQVISGASPTEKNSALWGARHSLLANAFGNDSHPFTGRGVNLTVDNFGYPVVDQDFDGNADNAHLLNFNDSPQAHNRAELPIQNTQLYPLPDVDYTYPDINNVFLAHIGTTLVKERDPNGNGIVDAGETIYDLNQNGQFDVNPVEIRVVKPSFHRPELLRINGLFNNTFDANWYKSNATVARVMRAHPLHAFVPPSTGNQAAPVTSRYLDDSNPADNTLLTSGGFKFDRDTSGNGRTAEQGVWGITSATRITQDHLHYDGDEDNDLDGVYEGITMDLDFPPQEDTANGKIYIPMFSMTIIDADGLINLNAHGNLSGNNLAHLSPYPFVTAPNAPFYNPGAGMPYSLSRSVHGVSSYEVNPIWALSAKPSDLANATLHANYFGAAPANWFDLANMEFWWINKGRAEAGSGVGSQPKVIPGRMGDADRILWMWQNGGNSGSFTQLFNNPANSYRFPFPGVWDQDDNRDRNEGGQFDPNTVNVNNIAMAQSRAGRHPISLGGGGWFWNPNDPKSTQRTSLPGTNNPMRWTQYTNYQLAGDAGLRGVSFVDPNNAMNVNLLMPNAVLGAQFQSYAGAPQQVLSNGPLADDMSEISLDRRYQRRPYDEVFELEDLAAIQVSETDFTNTGISSRIRDLMPGNTNPGYNTKAGEIRKRFTSESWDRKQFALALNSAARSWEFNHDSDGDGKLEFPPKFVGAPVYSSTDPFRPQVRRLLAVENGNKNQLSLQFRMLLNQFLDVKRVGPNAGNPIAGQLEFRPLTPHPTSISAAIPATAAYPPQSADQQEYWARRDRQQMARDLYVMLATFCRGDIDQTSGGAVDATAATAYQTPEQKLILKEMAQFAVNVVDSLDRDNSMTMFEYDDDLSNGWNLDDNPLSNDGTPPDRQVVIGVEAQELAFSETLWAWQDKLSADNSHTPFDEGTYEHHFLFIELRNLLPTAVDLGRPGVSTSKATAVWRIRRTEDNLPDTTNIPELPSASATNSPKNAIYFKAAAGSVSPGEQYTIATGDAYLGTGRPVDLYLDVDTTATTFEAIVPAGAGSSTFTNSNTPPLGGLARRTNLDLVEDDNFTKHELETGSAGRFVDRTDFGTTGGIPGPLVSTSRFQLILERRLNPELPNLSIADNPWVAVDFMSAKKKVLGIGASDDAATISTKLAGLKSFERLQPLERDEIPPTIKVDDFSGLPVIPYQYNSIHPQGSSLYSMNSNTQVAGGVYPLTQIHLDRDFASPIELLNVPLFSPRDTTSRLAGQNTPNGGHLARRRFLDTQTPLLNSMPPLNGNHWHRLLSFVEVPSHSHRQVGDAFALSRVPGKINLNTIRHSEVLAGLIDAPEWILPPDATGPTWRYGLKTWSQPLNAGLIAPVDNPLFAYVPRTLSPYGKQTGLRDLWADFLVARDGYDRFTELSLPGVPALPSVTSGAPETDGFIRSSGSKPFRDFSLDSSGTPNASVEQTLLRGQLSTDSGTPSTDLWKKDAEQERLFEIGGASDPLIRDRLLSKIANNTTTRSNVFFVYMTVRFHEVYEDQTTGAQRIGGRYDLDHNGNPDDDTHRGFFILDRSDAEQAYNPATQSFDWREIVRYRLTIH